MRKLLSKVALGLLATFIAGIAWASVNVTLNGTTYAIPVSGERGWGSAVTSWIQAASSHLLQKTGGTFTLGADVDFGSSFGLKSAYYKSRHATPATTGQIRLGNTEGIFWRNAANGANLGLSVDASNILTFNGNPIIGTAALTASRPVITDGAGMLSTEATLSPVRGGTGQDFSAATGVPYVSAGTFATEAQVSSTRGGTGVNNAGTLTYGANNITLTTSGATGVTLPTTGTLATLAGAEALTNKTIDADSNTISNIENGDIKAAAAIARSKLASGTASHVVVNDGTGVMTSEAALLPVRGGTGQDLSGATGVPYVTAGTFSTEAQVSGTRGGTGVSNAGTLTYGANNITLTTSGVTGVTLPTTGTLSTLAGAEALTNKTIDADSNTLSNIENGDIKAAAAIDRTKLASGTASHVVINDGTGVMTSEATLALTRGGTGQATAAAAFDALSPMTTNGDLITRASGTGSRIPVGSSGQVLKVVGTAPTWATVSGGINYMSGNPDAEGNVTSGFSTFADGAAYADGTGGVATATFAASATTPLRGTYSFLFTPGTLGDGVSYDFTIDSADQAKPLAISFDYSLSGTITEGDYQVYVYDVTNSQRIQPAPYKLSGTSGSQYSYKGEFQTNSNSTSYRVSIYQAVSTAVTLKTDNFSIAPTPVIKGAPVTDWSDWTPTGSWSTNATYTGKWRRVGDQMELQARISLAGASTATALSINMPSGYSIDNSKLVDAAGNVTPLGEVAIYDDSGSGHMLGSVTYKDGTSVYIDRLNVDATGGSTQPGFYSTVSATNPITFAANDRIQAYWRVPILGWSSAVTMSDSEDTRVVAMSATKSASDHTSTGAYQTVPTWAIENDTHNAFDASTGIYTVKVPGWYRASANLGYAATSAGKVAAMRLYFGSTFVQSATQDLTSFIQIPSVSGTKKLNAGDTIYLQSYQNTGGNFAYQATAGYSLFSVERVSGPAQIAASETISASYSPTGTATGIATGAPNSLTSTYVTWAKNWDTHGIFSTANGAVTIQSPGKYQINGLLEFTANGTGYRQLVVNQTGSVSRQIVIGAQSVVSASATAMPSGSAQFQCLTGDVLTIQAAQNSGGNLIVAPNGAANNHIDIVRVGN